MLAAATCPCPCLCCACRRCTFDNGALLAFLEFGRPLGVTISVLLAYLGVTHALTFAALLAMHGEAR